MPSNLAVRGNVSVIRIHIDVGSGDDGDGDGILADDAFGTKGILYQLHSIQQIDYKF